MSKKPTNAELLARIEELEKKVKELEEVLKALAKNVGPVISRTMVF